MTLSVQSLCPPPCSAGDCAHSLWLLGVSLVSAQLLILATSTTATLAEDKSFLLCQNLRTPACPKYCRGLLLGKRMPRRSSFARMFVGSLAVWASMLLCTVQCVCPAHLLSASGPLSCFFCSFFIFSCTCSPAVSHNRQQ